MTKHETTTKAELVAEIMGGDGTNFEAPDGRGLDEVCEAHGAAYTENGFGAVRWQFNDGSAIVEAETAWDIGFSHCDDCDCYCWEGVAGDYPEAGGHLPECRHATGGAS